jgi:hypothetical protein
MAAEIPPNIAKTKKNLLSVSISIPKKNLLGRFGSGRRVANLPAKTLEAALLMNQTPINKEAK